MSDTRRAVVFGGSGFVGTHLMRRLAQDGWRALAVDLVAPRDEGTAFVQGDVRIPISLPPEWDGATVFNLAAVHRTPGHPEHEYYETNLWGALNVTAWAAATGANTVVFTSSIAVYGASEDLKAETSPPTPDIVYGRSKLLAELVHVRWRDADSDRRLIVVRPAVIFGEGECGNFQRLAKALRQRRFAYPGRRDTIKSCGYVGDLVEAFLFALDEAGTLDLFNFCYPDRYSIETICETFHEVAGFPLPRSVPPLVLKVALRARGPEPLASLQARAKKLVTSTNIEPRALLDAGFTWPTDLDKALRIWQDATSGAFG